ncbi:exonuclease subunit SbcD [Budvicia diplopodorum]|uniref:exonuclease subunit SbcD n=1 Tax=Budvicia diplopodorum TaxID=1119056 RepID=UPI00135960AE|nr:exonuclease subunit SbcD [Budvicia diplopodorum]
MRIIHTSDWHLGQYFFTKSRAAEHQAFLSWLTLQVEQHQVDAIIVAGDIFDTTSPPSYARELYNQFIVRLQKTGCQLVILGGNHDSVATLNESRELLTYLNTQVIASVLEQPQRQVIVLNNRQGEPAAILCAIPFIRTRDIVTSQAGQSVSEKHHALQQAIADHYQQIYQLALDTRRAYSQPLPIIATGHLTTVGASTSDSVREIYIGTLDAFPAQAFPPADYIALGHIHRPQTVAKSEHIRYSGSPIALSFDEAGQQKSVVLAEFQQDNLAAVTLLAVPEFQPMRLIKGDIKQIETELAAFAHYQGERPVWLDIEVVSQHYLNDVQRQIQQWAEPLPVEVVLLRRSKDSSHRSIQRQARETLAELTVNDVFERRLALDEPQSDDDRQRQHRIKHLFLNLVDSVANDAESTDKTGGLAQ